MPLHERPPDHVPDFLKRLQAEHLPEERKKELESEPVKNSPYPNFGREEMERMLQPLESSE